MDLSLTQAERKNLKLAFKILKEWRDKLHIDPIWTIRVEVYNSEEAEEGMDVAFFNLSNAEYFVVVLSLSNDLMLFEEEDFVEAMHDIACHELVHLSSGDFYRTAQLSAGDNEQMQKELRYKYEQFTSRMQKAFMDMHRKVEKIEKSLKKAKASLKKIDVPVEKETEE